MTVCNAPAEHDVADGRKRGDRGHRTRRPGPERIVLGIAKRMAATDCQYPDSGVHRIGRHYTEHVPTDPNLAQQITYFSPIGSENPHATARLANRRPAGRSR
jgi:hypothetical protein